MKILMMDFARKSAHRFFDLLKPSTARRVIGVWLTGLAAATP